LPQKDDCTRAMSMSPAVEGTVPGIGGEAAWWLLAQADATSTRQRTRGVALTRFIGFERYDAARGSVTSGHGNLAWASVPE
jgi:hypothetical protein